MIIETRIWCQFVVHCRRYLTMRCCVSAMPYNSHGMSISWCIYKLIQHISHVVTLSWHVTDKMCQSCCTTVMTPHCYDVSLSWRISPMIGQSWCVTDMACLSCYITVITHCCHIMLLSWRVTVMTCHYHDASLAWCVMSWCVTVMRHHCHDASLSGQDKSQVTSVSWHVIVNAVPCHWHDASLFVCFGVC